MVSKKQLRNTAMCGNWLSRERWDTCLLAGLWWWSLAALSTKKLVNTA